MPLASTTMVPALEDAVLRSTAALDVPVEVADGAADAADVGAGLNQAMAHAVDVTVIDTDRRDGELSWADYRRCLALGGVVHSVGFLH